MATDALRVWLPVDDEDAWVLATVRHKSAGSITLSRLHAPEGVPAEVTVADELFAALTPATGDVDNDVSDLVCLADVNTGVLLHNLRLRYARDEIYTAIGPILVAVNPYNQLDKCGAEAIADARKLPPHVLTIALASYGALVKTGAAQSILISGESGAGKTETTKMAMACLAECSASCGASTDAALESGLLLEAFGNARTVSNHNSSRFGKWTVVHFDNDAKICGCRLDSFLLEKSRVAVHGGGERNYHIFYQARASTPARDSPQRALTACFCHAVARWRECRGARSVRRRPRRRRRRSRVHTRARRGRRGRGRRAACIC